MTLLSLKPDPTFKAKVPIPRPGGEPVTVQFTFKHRTRREFAAVLAGWDLDDEFTRENVATLLEQYGGSASAIADVYVRELTGARQ